ncbi:hypothetical protein EDD18DRAFT_1147249 [Armillaria luteobubalina]|uniref:Uncharacterized protein n=1 Tax=Armillaria luteobubalina TaxID=153913 RepID=A0AA39QFG2_9AGAR|nr:hypothetical protein EDD18DRAFT_1147249 [Armillaria luteobubalina]
MLHWGPVSILPLIYLHYLDALVHSKTFQMIPVYSFSTHPSHQSDFHIAPIFSCPVFNLGHGFKSTLGVLKLAMSLQSYGEMIILEEIGCIFVFSWDWLGASLCVWYSFLPTPHTPQSVTI